MTTTETVPLDCGYTLDELSDYLAHDRIPFNPAIETCPECLNALRALESVSHLSQDLVLQESRVLADPPPHWMRNLMGTIQSEMRAGRSVPVAHPDPRARVTITEGAIRALLRRIGDEVDGVVVGKCDLDGDLETPGSPVVVRLTVSVAWGTEIRWISAQLRRAVLDALARHTEIDVVAVDLAIEDLHGLPPKEDA